MEIVLFTIEGSIWHPDDKSKLSASNQMWSAYDRGHGRLWQSGWRRNAAAVSPAFVEM